MPDTVTAAGPWGALLAGVLLVVLAAAALVAEGVLAARARGGPVGPELTRPLDETLRLLRQRRRAPVSADLLLWRVAGGGLVVVALLMVALVPLGNRVVADLDVGVVWFTALDVLVWALVWLLGWGANAAYSLVGGYRFLALALAYELPLMFALVAPALAASSLDVAEVAAAQDDLWFVVWMPVAFVVFLVGVAAFSVRGPFTSPAGADVAGGVLCELSGVDRLVARAGLACLLVAGSAFAVPMFLGGGAGPVLPGWLWVLLKTAAVLTLLLALRRRLPVVRPELAMEVGWVVLLPAVLMQDLVVAVVVAVRG
ncbi:NADH-quinone oxidoreductase subunit H [Phycicoccus sp. BSK3Z-2]|uniref:NADH-quinone oxidoreductase subunit H n=1 Tax=Phycicoccus avicenniae TaxID=2828860 RepID=A0A941D5D6_9MICO|nr:complex I subunit 1 family protein [Phycicoccus avicenniae]MBR7742424.1 NADH-quinone oxidoreductase subunit H [Phycicoccus avicenniae]